MAYKHKRSSVAGKIPAAGNFDGSEIIVNTADGRAFINTPGGIAVIIPLSEINQLLAGKANSSHGHNASDITGRLKVANIPHMQGGDVDGYVRITNTVAGDSSTLGGINLDTSGHFWYSFEGVRKFRVWGTTGIVETTGDVNVTGAVNASNGLSAYSDIRLKSDVATIENALDKVNRMRGVTFTMNGEASTGVIAQEIREVLPEAVREMDDKEKTLTVQYGNIVGVLIEAIKELKAEVASMKEALNGSA